MDKETFHNFREQKVQHFILMNVPKSLHNASLLTIRRWAKKFLEQEYGSMVTHLYKNADGTVTFSFSKPRWASDATNSKRTHSAQEAIFRAIAEHFTGF